jgi:nucleotide-binding universal stress UspA family protein
VEFDAREERERMPEKVLLATDGSKDAALAARAAVDVCERTGAELHVVHAWHSVPTARLRPFMRAELKKLGNELLGEGVKRVEDSGGLVTGAHLLEGRAADEILDLAEQIGAGLVVIGSRGLGPVGRIALGSVSEAVIHHSRLPVLVLRGEDAWPPERVIFGDDGSEAARAAGDLGASLCGHHGARALVLHAYPRLPEVDAAGRGFDPRIVDDELRRAFSALLERSRELESRLGSRPKARLVVGEAAASLLEAAEKDAPERTLLAVGSRDLLMIGRMRLGSVSTKVVHAAKGPVLVHPPRHGET